MGTVSPSRVAARYLQAKEWLFSADSMTSSYAWDLKQFQKVLEEERTRDPRPNPYIINRVFIPLIHRGREFTEWALQTRVIPAGKSKPLEMAARLFGLQRQPKDVVKWYDTNKDRLEFLLEVGKWKERSTSADSGLELATAGAFKVHNTIGADEKHFEELQGLVSSATKAIQPVLDFKKVLYGDVFVVGQLKQSKTLAWYNVKDDDVYLRSLAKKGFDDLSSLVHELGHRYWFKFATMEQKKAVATLFYELSSKGRATQITRPKVGDPLPVPLKGSKEVPIITKDTGRTFELSTGGYVNADSLLKILQQQAAAKGVFPSAYSMTNYEEFFAECFAFYVLGRMKEDLATSFEKALKG